MPTVTLPRILAPAVGPHTTVEIGGADLDEAIVELLQRLPALGVHLFDEDGALRPHVLCFVDGEATRLADRSRPLDPRSEIRFLQAVSGG